MRQRDLIEGEVVWATVERQQERGYLMSTDLKQFGYLAMAELTWGRVVDNKALPLLELGTGMLLKVIDAKPREDGPGQWLRFSARALLPDPWESVEQIYPVGTRVRAETSSIVNSGAVFQLPGGLSAYVNDQDLCWKNPRVTAEDFLRVGELEDLVITESDALQRNLRASIKLATPDPWPGLAQLASNMGRQSGEVQNVVEFGAFVRLDSGFIGLLHRSQLERPDRRLEAAKGDRLDVVIQHVDLDNRRIALELA